MANLCGFGGCSPPGLRTRKVASGDSPIVPTGTTGQGETPNARRFYL
jgi:hypothetical protein